MQQAMQSPTAHNWWPALLLLRLLGRFFSHRLSKQALYPSPSQMEPPQVVYLHRTSQQVSAHRPACVSLCHYLRTIKPAWPSGSGSLLAHSVSTPRSADARSTPKSSQLRLRTLVLVFCAPTDLISICQKQHTVLRQSVRTLTSSCWLTSQSRNHIFHLLHPHHLHHRHFSRVSQHQAQICAWIPQLANMVRALTWALTGHGLVAWTGCTG